MNILTAHTLAEVIAERDWDQAHGTLVAEHIDPADTLAWVDYRNNRGEIVHFEFDGGAL